MTVKALIRKGMKRVLPAPWYWQVVAWQIGHFDLELQLLPYLCDRTKISIDVGASIGSYTVHMLNHSRKCFAFEPRRGDAARIVQRLGSNPRLRVETVALSDRAGTAELRILADEAGRSTLEQANRIEQLGKIEVLSVPMRRLDDYDDIGPVGFIKIDVEGHEEAVLRGARRTLLRDRPSLIVEIEERHKPHSVRAVGGFLGELGYEGFFFRRGRLNPMATFKPEEHQDVSNILGGGAKQDKYINNFVFMARESVVKVRHLMGRPS